MPTGYTAAVQSGEITELRQFAMQCARAFGALITMRDDPWNAPIPAKLEPDTQYHDEQIAELNQEIARLAAMGEQEKQDAAAGHFAEERQSWQRRYAEREQDRGRYTAMLEKVRAWHPAEACTGLKDFMVEQLESSLDFDCSPWEKYYPKPTEQPAEAWHAATMAETIRCLTYHSEERAKEIERTNERNLWLDALRTSLVQP